MFSVERHTTMIKDEKRRTTKMMGLVNRLIRDIPTTRSVPIRGHLFRISSEPVRQGASQQVLDVADRMIEEYKSDLDYLKDR
jgi:hypothetical protein